MANWKASVRAEAILRYWEWCGATALWLMIVGAAAGSLALFYRYLRPESEVAVCSTTVIVLLMGIGALWLAVVSLSKAIHYRAMARAIKEADE